MARPYLEAELADLLGWPAVRVSRRFADQEVTADFQEAGGAFGRDGGWSEGAGGDGGVACPVIRVVRQHFGPAVVGGDVGQAQDVDRLVEEGNPPCLGVEQCDAQIGSGEGDDEAGDAPA